MINADKRQKFCASAYQRKGLVDDEVDAEFRDIAQLLGNEPLFPVTTSKKKENDDVSSTHLSLEEETDKLLSGVRFTSERAGRAIDLIETSGLARQIPTKKVHLPYSLKFNDGEPTTSSGFFCDSSSEAGEQSNQQHLESARAHARARFVSQMQEKNIEQVKICAQQTINELEKNYIIQLDNLREDNLKLEARTSHAEKAHKELQQELDDSHRIIDLLNSKIRVLTEHQVELEQKLEQYRTMEPILSAMTSKFAFTTPEQAVEKMERLEAREVELFVQLTESQQRVNEVERKLQEVQQQMRDEATSRRSDLLLSVQKTQRDLEEARKNAHSAEAALQKVTQSQQCWSHVALSLRLLYEAVSGRKLAEFYEKSGGKGGGKEKEKERERENDDSLDTSQSSDILSPSSSSSSSSSSASSSLLDPTLMAPDPDDLEMLVRALTMYVSGRNETEAGKRVREFTGIANTIWLKHFADIPELKFAPKKVFVKLSAMVDVLKATIAELQQRDNRMRFEVSEMKKEKNKMSVENRALKNRITDAEQAQREAIERRLKVVADRQKEMQNSKRSSEKTARRQAEGDGMNCLSATASASSSSSSSFGSGSASASASSATTSRSFGSLRPHTSHELGRTGKRPSSSASGTTSGGFGATSSSFASSSSSSSYFAASFAVKDSLSETFSPAATKRRQGAYSAHSGRPSGLSSTYSSSSGCDINRELSKMKEKQMNGEPFAENASSSFFITQNSAAVEASPGLSLFRSPASSSSSSSSSSSPQSTTTSRPRSSNSFVSHHSLKTPDSADSTARSVPFSIPPPPRALVSAPVTTSHLLSSKMSSLDIATQHAAEGEQIHKRQIMVQDSIDARIKEREKLMSVLHAPISQTMASSSSSSSSTSSSSSSSSTTSPHQTQEYAAASRSIQTPTSQSRQLPFYLRGNQSFQESKEQITKLLEKSKIS
ncbi:uncharacterized protein MONOS_5644 [Monocercomonoides exilis]|uniref:uncharacterized protein n=1 Tax=Monocercomonoides exilis TaxID=2049356 RepID=UPI00355ABC1E|nr:hypothetical protein MONOS_5644 [Monocercomonoides exilis]|eukprot:MONOS_5644.1-p1 / transcript=MONOS_5644.1 / gene=MONOS_5644 / organism=Monocercomonoides_exilis_PA203 / gene_product=unspecified product / transcript_product=unspecified product / location=Mono_scaffold00167:1715-4874(+) / protein_length=947 / sequence_SO=supercontig / SO=protein_coding / is_pseudo=false